MASELTDLDRTLIQILQEDGRIPFRRIARRLDVSEKVVRKRVSALRENVTIEIAPVTAPYLYGYTGLASTGIRVSQSEAADAVAAAVAALPLVDHVVPVAGRFDIFAELICRDREELFQFADRELRTLRGIARFQLFPYLTLYYYQAIGLTDGSSRPPRATDAALEAIDAKIVEALHIDGRMSVRSIARRLEVSEAHVRHRMKNLTESGMLKIIAIANPPSVGLAAGAWVRLSLAAMNPTGPTAKTLSEVPSVTYVAVTAGGADMFAEILCTDMQELGRIIDEEIRVIPGVQSLEVFSHLGPTQPKRPRYSLGASPPPS